MEMQAERGSPRCMLPQPHCNCHILKQGGSDKDLIIQTGGSLSYYLVIQSRDQSSREKMQTPRSEGDNATLFFVF